MRYMLFLLSGLLLSGCALLEGGQPWYPPLVLAADSTGAPALGQGTTVIYAKNFYGSTYKDRSDHRAQAGGTYVEKARAPVASGPSSQAQDFTKAGQHGGALATAPHASADATTHTGVPPWVLVVVGVVVVLLILAGLAYRYRRRLTGLLAPV